MINALASDGGLLRLKSPDAERYLSLRVVVGSSFQSPISNLVHHRVAVHDFDGAITHLISQSDLLRLFHTNPKLLGKSGPLTVSALRLGTREVRAASSAPLALLMPHSVNLESWWQSSKVAGYWSKQKSDGPVTSPCGHILNVTRIVWSLVALFVA